MKGFNVETIQPKPGDVLVFSTPGMLKQEEVDRIVSVLKKFEETKDCKALILEKGMRLECLKREDLEGLLKTLEENR